MIRAHEFRRVAAQLAAELGAAVAAAVLHHVNRAVLGAAHDHRHRADIRAPEIARIGDLGLESDEIPCRALEDALDLGLVDLVRGVDPVRNVRQPFLGPDVFVAERAPRAIRRHRAVLLE